MARLALPAMVSFNTQPPEGGCCQVRRSLIKQRFQHTAARRRLACCIIIHLYTDVSTHSRPKAAVRLAAVAVTPCEFQHTAARRRLTYIVPLHIIARVSTHSRPKAAAALTPIDNFLVRFQHTAARRRLNSIVARTPCGTCFNTQPPEGGWRWGVRFTTSSPSFNTQPPEGGWS